MRNHKWTYSKARRCILLGYGLATTRYRLYDVNHSKVLYSRNEDDEPREPAEQDMYLDTGSDAESVMGQPEPMDGQAEEMVDQVDQCVDDQYVRGNPLICMANG